MSQDIVSDALNQIMNIKKAGKNVIKIKRKSGLLLKILEMMQKEELIEFKIAPKNELEIKIKSLSEGKSIKPRFYVKVEDIDKYIRRFLPARGVGTLIISTNKGLMNHDDALKNKLGGSLIAYYY